MHVQLRQTVQLWECWEAYISVYLSLDLEWNLGFNIVAPFAVYATHEQS